MWGNNPMYRPDFSFRSAADSRERTVRVIVTRDRQSEADSLEQCRWCGRLTKHTNVLGYCGKKCLIEDLGPAGESRLRQAEADAAEASTRAMVVLVVLVVIVIGGGSIWSALSSGFGTAESPVAESAPPSRDQLGAQFLHVWEESGWSGGASSARVPRFIKIGDYDWKFSFNNESSWSSWFGVPLSGSTGKVWLRHASDETKVLEYLTSTR